MTRPIIPYVKLSAQGNDFIVIDGHDSGENNYVNHLSPHQMTQWADRSSGIGFDQLLVLYPTTSPTGFDVAIYNADGSEAEQCGNGMRALAYYLMVRHPELKTQAITLHPPAGRVDIRNVEPRHANKQALVSVSLPGPVDIKNDSNEAFKPATHVVHLSMGNPHLILVWPQQPNESECFEVGGQLQNRPSFLGGINVSLAHVTETGINLRVYERGVGPTLACGSGACATVAALTTLGLTTTKTTVHQPGGSLVIDWQTAKDLDNKITLTGSVDWIGKGHLTT